MFLTLLALTATQQEPATLELEDLGSLVEGIHADHDVPALWVGIADTEGLVAAGARGVRERGSKETVTVADRLHLGSCSKSMTASLAAILAEAETIAFDDSIALYFPDVDVHAGWKSSTLRHLMAHRGGAPFNLVDHGPLGLFILKHEGEPRTHRETLAAGLLRVAPKHEIGAEFVYSNDGYALLAAALEAKTDRAWRELIGTELFGKIGVETFGFGPVDALEDQPVGHTQAGAPAPEVDNPEAYGPAGRVHMPLEDWARYVAWHLRGAAGGHRPAPQGALPRAAPVRFRRTLRVRLARVRAALVEGQVELSQREQHRLDVRDVARAGRRGRLPRRHQSGRTDGRGRRRRDDHGRDPVQESRPVTVTLVTGSARGLGLEIARSLRADGDRVHVVWNTSEHLVSGLESEFGAERVHRADLEDGESAQRLVSRVAQAEGGLDRLVHAVGAYESGATSALGHGVLARLWSSNVLSAQHAFDAARPHLRKAESGRAVFFGCAGLAGLRARRTTAAYAAAKSALVVLARSWALEEAPYGVTVNVVSPGHVPHAAAHPDTLDEELHARLPAGRAGTPREVAEAVRWLVSDAASYTSGSELLVSGGWLI